MDLSFIADKVQDRQDREEALDALFQAAEERDAAFIKLQQDGSESALSALVDKENEYLDAFDRYCQSFDSDLPFEVSNG